MGWAGSGDTQSQVLLTFASQAEAQAYAASHGIEPKSTPRRRAGSSCRPTPTTFAD